MHLADLLLHAEQWVSSLDHCAVLLAQRPDDRAALHLAARAADGAGEVERAAAYRRLMDALGGPDVASVPPLPVSATAEVDEYDQFLREVLEEANVDVEMAGITLADVGGLDEVKRRLHTSFLGPMRNPELRAMYGKSLRGGLLLYGPPGCGKT